MSVPIVCILFGDELPISTDPSFLVQCALFSATVIVVYGLIAGARRYLLRK